MATSANDTAGSQKKTLASLSKDDAGPIIVWFRRDLRLADHPALNAACSTGRKVLCIYVHETVDALRADGGATKWWLHHSLSSLDEALRQKGTALVLFEGDPASLVPDLAKAIGASGVVWSRRYDAADRALDAAVKSGLETEGVIAESFNGHLLYEPWEVKSQSGHPMKVFTPFWRAALALREPAAPMKAPAHISGYDFDGSNSGPKAIGLDTLRLLPTTPDWASGLRADWHPGEAGAAKRLHAFLDSGLKGYAEGRDMPGRPSTSKLSPYLKFGELSPRQIWAATHHAMERGATKASKTDATKFLAEIGWREFSYHLLFYFPKLATENFNSKFDAFPWKRDNDRLHAWQRGQTGYPVVDAGMRQLWQTGWMHNRIRMVTASFLIKHLLIDWRVGEEWFWDTLVDADPASNTASWQWVAGSGADAAPYYRIFNPVIQGTKFDTEGDYVRHFVPELAKLPAKYIHQPWEAPAEVLKEAGITLGKTYPKPIVDHAEARDKALKTFSEL